MENNNSQYNQNRYNRKRNISHWGLAFHQIRQHPIMFVLFLPIIVLVVVIWVKMDYLLSIFNAPEIILSLYEIVIKAFGVIIPILLAWSVIESIGSLTSRKDEASIQMAFDEKELRNGSPILMYKYKDKTRGYIKRVWYSPIPLKIWLDRQDTIEHQMKEHFIKELDYDDSANDNRIVMISAKGIKRVEEMPVYDKELEMDMEKILK